jgi:hypothetical protein
LRPPPPLFYVRRTLMTAQPAFAPAQAPAPGFPPRLQDVPIEVRVGERFGWLAGAAAIAGAVYAVWFGGVLLGPKSKPDLQSIGIEVGCVIGAIFFAWYEIWRRLKRTVLVARGASIGVYRKGALEIVIGRGQMQPYELRILNTVRYLLVPVLLGPMLLLVGLASLAGSGSGKMDSVWMALAGGYVTSIGVSIVWTRILCKHFFIAKGGGREEVLFTSADLTRLFGQGG